jgi:hypothetical protein
MEGRWGRRIYGSVTREEDRTKFHLEMDTREGEHITSTYYVLEDELAAYPWLYGQTLDSMVAEMEALSRAFNHTQGNQS